MCNCIKDGVKYMFTDR